MKNLREGHYSLAISGISVPGHKDFSLAAWQYQFIATDKNTKILGRSQVYTNVTLSGCGVVAP